MSESSKYYLDKVVVIDGEHYNNTAVHADNSSKMVPVAGKAIPTAGVVVTGDDLKKYSGIYVANNNFVCNDSMHADSSHTNLETLVTSCSAMTMYDHSTKTFVNIQAEKLAILNQLDIFNTNTFSIAWPGMNIPVKYTFDDGVSWGQWIEKNSSTGFTILPEKATVNEVKIPENTVVVEISQEGVATTYYVVATITNGEYTFVSSGDHISKNGTYFFITPGFPADVQDIKIGSGSDGAGKCKIDLSFTCVQGTTKCAQVTVAVSTSDFPTWANVEAETNIIEKTTIKVSDSTNNVNITFSGLEKDITHYVSIFPQAADSNVVNKNAESGANVNRAEIKTFAIILLDPPTLRKTNNSGESLEYYGGNRYLKNFLSTISTPDGYTLSYGTDDDADIKIHEPSRAIDAGDYETELELKNQNYQWNLDGVGSSTCIIPWSISRLNIPFYASFINSTGYELDLPTVNSLNCGYCKSIQFAVQPAHGLNVDRLPMTERCVKVAFTEGAPEYSIHMTKESSRYIFEIRFKPFVGTASGRFTINVPEDIARNFGNVEIKQEFSITGQVSTFADNSWEAILSAAEAGKIPATWEVGNTKSIELSAGKMGDLSLDKTTLSAMIINKTSTCLTFCFATSGSSPKPIAFADTTFGSDSYGAAFNKKADAVLNMDTADNANNARVNGYKTRLKWASCKMRSYILGSNAGEADRTNTLYSRLPKTLRDVMCIAKIKSIGANYDTTNSKLGTAQEFESYDVLPLLSASDLGIKTTENKNAASPLSYFKNKTLANINFYQATASTRKCGIHLRDAWVKLGYSENTSSCSHASKSDHCAFYAYMPNYLLRPYEDRSRGVAPIFFIGKKDATAPNGVKVIGKYK